MWGITEAELHEREHSVKRQRELADKVKKREELLERLEKNRQHRDASMNTDPKSHRQKHNNHKTKKHDRNGNNVVSSNDLSPTAGEDDIKVDITEADP